MEFDITASIVVYHTEPKIINAAIRSFLNTKLNVHLYISDNSDFQYLQEHIIQDKRITYQFNGLNLGFGEGHNVCIRYALKKSSYHLILNPDVYFSHGTLEILRNYMESNKETGLIAPKIVYPTGEVQFSCRLIPSFLDLVIRRLPLIKVLFNKRLQNQELRFTNYQNTIQVPFLLGCFLLVRTEVLSEMGGFDNRFFMYMEDLDLCRRISSKYKLIFFADISIVHLYEKGSSKKIKLLKFHLISAIKYFNKWGWVNDPERVKINKNTIDNIRQTLNHKTIQFNSRGVKKIN